MLRAVQHYLTMLGATVVIPTLLVPAMGGDDDDKAQTIQRCPPPSPAPCREHPCQGGARPCA